MDIRMIIPDIKKSNHMLVVLVKLHLEGF